MRPSSTNPPARATSPARALEQRGGHHLLAEPLPHVTGGGERDAQGSRTAPRPASLRVASFNIRTGLGRDGRHSWPLRAGACAKAIAGLAADVVGLQEVRAFQERGLARRLPGYAGAGAGRTDGRRRGERCTVAYLHLPAASRPVDGPLVLGHAVGPGFALVGQPDHPHRHAVPLLGPAHGRPLRGRERALGRRLPGVTAAQRRGAARTGSTPRCRGSCSATSTRRPETPPSRAWSPEACATRSPIWASAGRRPRPTTRGTDPPTARASTTSSSTTAGTCSSARIDHARPGGRLPSDHWPVVAEVALRRPRATVRRGPR